MICRPAFEAGNFLLKSPLGDIQAPAKNRKDERSSIESGPNAGRAQL